ncbi:MAG: ImuA family protein [Phycisphaerales bacterium]
MAGAERANRSRAVALRDLAERIDAVLARGAAAAACDRSAVAQTGWIEIDRVLPGGGLRRGAVHEWVSDAHADRWWRWSPPLLILLHLSVLAARPRAWTVWIGRRVWPYGRTLAAGLPRSLLIDPPDEPARLWAIDLALRTPGLVVVADGSSFDLVGTRRLQLAAEAGGSLGLIARPARDLSSLSAAATRWAVRPSAGASERWRVRLVRCKGARAGAGGEEWALERTDDGGIALAPEVRRGRGASAAAG